MARIQFTDEDRQVILKLVTKFVDQAMIAAEDELTEYLDGEHDIDWEADDDELTECIADAMDKALEAYTNGS